MTRRLTSLLLLLCAARVHAHSVPIPPSLCTFDPLVVSAPTAGIEGAAAAPTAADVFRLVYDAGASMLQPVCAADPADPQNRCAATTPPRAFSAGAVSGTLAIPPFTARLLASGDVTGAATMAFTVDGATASAVMAITTGPVAVGDTVVVGAPIGADGRLTLVATGTVPGLAPPLGRTPLVLRMTCSTSPPPDLDQFVPSTRTTKVAGKIASDGASLRVAFRAGSEASPPDFARPVVVRIGAGDAAVATLAVPDGLRPQGRRKFVGEVAGGSVVVTRGRGTRYKMTVRTTAAAPPAATTPVEVAFQVGGLLSRGTRTFRSGRRGLHAP